MIARFLVRGIITLTAIILQLTVQANELAAQKGSEITTPDGILVFQEATLSDRHPIGCTRPTQWNPTPCREAKEGRQFLHVELSGAVAVEKDMLDDVYVTASDSSRATLAISSRNFTVDSQGRMQAITGYTLLLVVEASAEGFKLFWPDNEPIELTLEGG